MALVSLNIPPKQVWQRFALIYILMAITLSVLLIFGINFDRKIRINNNELQEQSRLISGHAQIIQDLKSINVDLRIISQLPLLERYLDSNDPLLRIQLEELLKVFAEETGHYDQIRYLDLNGKEDIRIQFNQAQRHAVISTKLQNKAKRYYFKETIKLNANDIFVSPLDLNIENGRLERPYKPMIRYARPVFDSKNTKRGIVILNYLGKELLRNFRTAMHSDNPQSGMLLTHDGYWLKGPTENDEWGFMLDKDQLTFANRFPEAWPSIRDSEQGSLLTEQGLFVYLTVSTQETAFKQARLETKIINDDKRSSNNHWKIVTFVPNTFIFESALYYQGFGKALVAFIYLIFAIIAFLVAKLSFSRKLANDKIIQLNQELEKRAIEHAKGEEKLAVTLRSIADGVLTTDGQGHITRLNTVAEQLTGWSQQDALGRPVADILHIINQKTRQPEPLPIEIAPSQAIGSQQHDHSILISRDGRELPIEDSWARIRNNEDTIIGTVLVFRDISQRKLVEQGLISARQQAERANQTKDSFLATMSHEIRTPLTGMLGMLEILSMTKLDAAQDKTLSAAWDSARNLLRIVNDVLDWSKIQDGKLALAPKSTSLPQLLQEVVNTYSGIASSKYLLLSLYVDPKLSAAHIIDSLRLSQILNNFVSNAIKFTHNGTIELRADLLEQLESGERIRFSVQDTGIGIPEELQKNLFQRYQQESADTARQYGGTGLGLSICLRLAELLDGHIDVESEAAHGTRFSITAVLPVSAAPGEKIPSANADVEQRKVTPLTFDSTGRPLILVVDDHPTNRNLLSQQIHLLGLQAESAENGLKALSKWESNNYTLIITDCHMPEMDGYTFTQTLRKIEKANDLKSTPVIAWTANARPEEKQFCCDAGMDDLLVKPANLAQLKTVLQKWLKIIDLKDESRSNSHKDNKAEGFPINYEILSQSIPDTEEHLAILKQYQLHLRLDLENIQAEMTKENIESCQEIAHRMKGSSKMVGASDIATACYKVELAAKNKYVSDIIYEIEQLESSIEKFESYLTLKSVV